MRRLGNLRTIVLMLLVVGAVPLVAYALNLMSPSGKLFDLQEVSGGNLSNGTGDAYDGMYSLRVNSV